MYTTKTVDSQTTSPWIPLDDNQAAFNVSVAVAVTGTLTYTVQFTLDNIQDPSVTPVAFEVSSLTGKTTAASTSLRSSVKAVRLSVTSYTSGSATIGVRQGTSWDGADFATSAGPVTLLQSGILFAIFAGDGGANGLTFTGTAGQFTLSAAPLTNIWNLFKTPVGGYCYLPAGAGGLVSGGLYFFRMTSDTAGEVYQEKYTPGSGKLTIPSSPTSHPNLTSGRITQSTSEIVVSSFSMPGNSMGENGLFRALIVSKCESNAAARTFRVRVGGTAWASLALTTSNTVMDFEMIAQNQGVLNQQVITRLDTRVSSGSISLFNDYTSVDTSVDNTVQFSMQTASSAVSCFGMLRECVIKYSGV